MGCDTTLEIPGKLSKVVHHLYLHPELLRPCVCHFFLSSTPYQWWFRHAHQVLQLPCFSGVPLQISNHLRFEKHALTCNLTPYPRRVAPPTLMSPSQPDGTLPSECPHFFYPRSLINPFFQPLPYPWHCQ